MNDYLWHYQFISLSKYFIKLVAKNKVNQLKIQFTFMAILS